MQLYNKIIRSHIFTQ